MRRIKPNEECISASEIVRRFKSQTGFDLHATNAGNAAKSLNLDYIEVEPEIDVSGMPSWKKEKRYSVIDLLLIFEKLNELAQRREKYDA